MPRVIVAIRDAEEALRDRLERKPSKEEFASFLEWLETDAPQWLSDNTRSWVRSCPCSEAEEADEDTYPCDSCPKKNLRTNERFESHPLFGG